MAKQKDPKRVEAAHKNPWIQYIKKHCAVNYKNKPKEGSRKCPSKKRRRSVDAKPSYKKGELSKKLRAMVVRRGSRTRKRKRKADYVY